MARDMDVYDASLMRDAETIEALTAEVLAMDAASRSIVISKLRGAVRVARRRARPRRLGTTTTTSPWMEEPHDATR